MNDIIQKFVKVCPKSGKIKGFKTPAGFYKLLLPLVGLAALLWILIRVIPKPSRVQYPCIKAATPLAFGFVGQLMVMALSGLAFIKSKKTFVNSPVFFAGVFLILGAGGTYWINKSINGQKEASFPNIILAANQPIGVAKGIFPGRVVWVHNSNAVNQSCVPDSFGHAWFMSENNNQSVVDGMVSTAIQNLTGTTNDTAAWNAIFLYHNTTAGRGSVGYTKGEQIFIKINATSAWAGNFDPSTLEPVKNSYYGLSETSAAVVMSVLKGLVNVVGVPQSDIFVGDPLRHIYTHLYSVWHPAFPNVHYLDHDPYYTSLGREQVQMSTTAKVYYSDKGTVLHNYGPNNKPSSAVYYDYLYKPLETATYVINIPQLKGHEYAGATMFAKDNFGNQTGIDASHLHNGLVLPPLDSARTGYGLYRVQVDMMGSKYLSGKMLFHLLDALWSADMELATPKKWMMQPFNNEYMASVFASFDPVAIECVGYDFLRAEFTSERSAIDGSYTYVQTPGVNDYLQQAADSTNWPAGIKYDPDSSGASIPSLGVCEFSNDPVDQKYSRNLGTGNGIYLLATSSTVTAVVENSRLPGQFILYPNYPNPFNPSTTIKFSLNTASKVNLLVYDLTGKLVDVIMKGEFKSAGTYDVVFNASRLTSGVYFLQLEAGNYSKTQKMVYLK
jgi:hypothetical protein